jgi:Uma2 family endonuclease
MAVAEREKFRWDLNRYLDVTNSGVLANEKVELIDGEIVLISAQLEPHAMSVSKTTRELMAIFPEPYYVKIQSTFRLGKWFAPEPDIMVLTEMKDTGRELHDLPLLVVEVADTSLSYDRGSKASMYASRGVRDYWVINLTDRQVEVFRDPVEDSKAAFNWRYASVVPFRPGEQVQLLALPNKSIAVERLLS